MTEHTHHWLCEPPAGATSKARCKTCGEESEFANSFTVEQTSPWSSSNRNRAKNSARASTVERHAKTRKEKLMREMQRKS